MTTGKQAGVVCCLDCVGRFQRISKGAIEQPASLCQIMQHLQTCFCYARARLTLHVSHSEQILLPLHCCCCRCCRSLQALVEVGPHAPAGQTGAKFIIRKDGRRINLAYLRDGASKQLEVRRAHYIRTHLVLKAHRRVDHL